MQENFRVKGKELYVGFVDLEKAFDRVPKEVISWAMRKLGVEVEEWLVSAAISMYSGVILKYIGLFSTPTSLLVIKCKLRYKSTNTHSGIKCELNISAALTSGG